VKKILFLMLGGALLAAASMLWRIDERLRLAKVPPPSLGAVPFAVLGDSDSHAYHDDLNFARWPQARGGDLRDRSWQWTEVLAHLRAAQLDPGPWGVWGTRYRRLSQARDAVGQDGRFPAKQDYRHNLAYSGAVCANLNDFPQNQAARLLAVVREAPERWQRGVVLVRIGTNDVGGLDSLEALSRDPSHPETVARIEACVQHIARAVGTLRANVPGLRVVLVGIFNNADWEKFHARWQSPQAQANIHAGMARFNEGLKAIVQGDANMAFFDDQAWFNRLWGTRLATGVPAYKKVRFGPRFEVSNTGGDTPDHATLGDGHAGSVWNALWAQSLVELLNQRFGLGVPALQDDELVRFIDPDGRFGMR